MSTHRRSAKGIWIGSFMLTTLFLALSVQYLDLPVALFVRDHLYNNSRWTRLTGDLPDLLLLVVVATTVASSFVYVTRSKKGIYDRATRFAKVATCAAPVSYLAKVLLKWLFGRVNTRQWLMEPQFYGFHWFQGGKGWEGFPSGHMLVAVVLLCALCRFYPESRRYSLAMAGMLGAALIATNYHFLSDVVAGAYLGGVIEAAVSRIVLREPWRVGNSCV